jgi:adenosylmethionine-8-amino-7-oxononanoate aminotransferase
MNGSDPTSARPEAQTLMPSGRREARPSAIAQSLTRRHAAHRHLWPHFTELSRKARDETRVIVRGAGCYVWDDQGRRYLDGLSALFCVNVGYGRGELAHAAETQLRELAFFTNWSYAHPRAVELAERLARLAPGDLNRVFFTSGGSEAVESAIKLARQFHKLSGKSTKTKIIARETAYHGTTLGALSATGIPAVREPFEPLAPGGCHVPNTNVYRLPLGQSETWFSDQLEQRVLFEGPDTVAAVILEPVQNAGGCLVPPPGYFDRIRGICDRYDLLLISDEVICAWGRLGEFFGSERYAYQPDIITTAKGLTSAYIPMGAMIASERIASAFEAEGAAFLHGFTFGGHPVASAVALANIDLIEREGLLEHVRSREGSLRAMLESLRDLPIVGDVRGAGYFHAIELVKDRDSKQSFSAEECERVLRGCVSRQLLERGLICRADDRGEPVIQLAPPLIAGREQFEEIEAILRPTLQAAWRELERGG